MGFSKMMELLQQKNKGKIVFCNTGNFYIAIGKDAVLLNNLIDLKLSCLKQEICKVGFPINALEKYVEKLDSTKHSYIIFDYDKQNRELKEIHSKIGKQHKITSKNINCLECKGVSAYKDDEYMEAIYKLMD